MEVELQFVYRGDAPPVVPVELMGLRLADSDTLGLTDTYRDSEQLDLRRSGCSLRVRVADGRPRAQLTWKGRAKRRRDGGKKRTEVELALPEVPEEPEAFAEILRAYGLSDLMEQATGLGDGVQLRSIGELRTERSRHTFVQGLHRLELTWDRVRYPVGPDEVRLEVEVKSSLADRYLTRASAELRDLLGNGLERARRGKVRELCDRLYPELARTRGSLTAGGGTFTQPSSFLWSRSKTSGSLGQSVVSVSFRAIANRASGTGSPH